MPRRKTYEEVKAFIEGEEGNGCMLVSNEYENSYTPLWILCGCGKEIFPMTWKEFTGKKRRQCRACTVAKRNPTNWNFDSVKLFVEVESDSGCKLVSTEYSGTGAYMDFICACGEPFTTALGNFIYHDKRQCNDCGTKLRAAKNHLTYEQVKADIEAVGCKLLSDTYVGVYDLLEIECKCGRPFARSIHKFNNAGHHYCEECMGNISYGALKIKEILENNNEHFTPEFKIEELRDINPLRFDFATFWDKEKTQIKVMIEFHGEQHYRPIEMFGGQEQFEYQQRHDQMKRDYCKKQNIKLIEIPYWDFKNIEAILKKEVLSIE